MAAALVAIAGQRLLPLPYPDHRSFRLLRVSPMVARLQEMLDDYRGLMEGNDAADINSLEATTGSGAAGTGIAAGDRPRLIDNAASTASGFVGKIAAFLTPPPAGGIIAGLPYTSTSSSRPSSSMPAFGSAAAAAARPAGGYRDSATTSSRQAPAAAGSTGSGVI